MSELKVGDQVQLTDWGRSFYTKDARQNMALGTVVSITPLSYPYPSSGTVSATAVGVDIGGGEIWTFYDAALEVVLPIPTFASVEEADAWLEAHTPTEGR